MNERITLRLTPNLKKALTGYAHATGKSVADSARLMLERGIDKSRSRHSWDAERADLSKLLRRFGDASERASEDLVTKATEQIRAEIATTFAAIEDRINSFAQLVLDVPSETSTNQRPSIDPHLAIALAELRGMGAVLVNMASNQVSGQRWTGDKSPTQLAIQHAQVAFRRWYPQGLVIDGKNREVGPFGLPLPAKTSAA